jgi:hypothetical protein
MDESTPVSSVGNRAAAATVPSMAAFTVPSTVAARASLARLLALAPHSASALLTARETSEAVQGFVAQLPHTDLQPLLAIVLDNFRALSLNRLVQSVNLLTECLLPNSGCRVVQALLQSGSPEQRRQLARQLEEPVTLLLLVGDRSGTFVAQACLGHLARDKAALVGMVTALKGQAGALGCTQHGTSFLQRLVEVLGAEGAACSLLQEDILASIGSLVISEVRRRAVAALTLP